MLLLLLLHCFIFLIFSRFSSKEAKVVVSFSSWVESVSVLSLFSKSCILVSTVVSSVLSVMERVASAVVSPSFTIITRFWHLAHHNSPVLSLNSGEAQAGQERSVRVAPCLRKSAMACRSLVSFFDTWFASNKKTYIISCLFEYRFEAGGWEAFFMVGKKKLKEYEDRIGQAVAVLGQVSEDSTTPRNIRRTAKESIDALGVSADSPAVRASNAIAMLDEILQDPNMPPYTRVKLWNVMSLLEAIKD